MHCLEVLHNDSDVEVSELELHSLEMDVLDLLHSQDIEGELSQVDQTADSWDQLHNRLSRCSCELQI